MNLNVLRPTKTTLAITLLMPILIYIILNVSPIDLLSPYWSSLTDGGRLYISVEQPESLWFFYWWLVTPIMKVYGEETYNVFNLGVLTWIPVYIVSSLISLALGAEKK